MKEVVASSIGSAEGSSSYEAWRKRVLADNASGAQNTTTNGKKRKKQATLFGGFVAADESGGVKAKKRQKRQKPAPQLPPPPLIDPENPVDTSSAEASMEQLAALLA